jgi:putative lipoic acid-binding regulatory protein
MNYICILIMENKNSEEFYAKLKTQLADTSIWPSKYMYKFIVPTLGPQIKEIEKVFDNTGAVINTKESSKGKYTSVSILVKMKNPDAVIAKYIEISKVEGVISL